MSTSNSLLIASLDEQKFALHLSAVERIVRAVEVTPLPSAPDTVLGVINIQGQIVPVINMRRRFALPERELKLSDQFIIARTSSRTVALVVDAVSDVVAEVEHQVTAAEKILPRLEHVEGVIKINDTLVLVHNLDKLLSLEDEVELSHVMDHQGDAPESLPVHH